MSICWFWKQTACWWLIQSSGMVLLAVAFSECSRSLFCKLYALAAGYWHDPKMVPLVGAYAWCFVSAYAVCMIILSFDACVCQYLSHKIQQDCISDCLARLEIWLGGTHSSTHVPNLDHACRMSTVSQHLLSNLYHSQLMHLSVTFVHKSGSATSVLGIAGHGLWSMQRMSSSSFQTMSKHIWSCQR